MRCAAIDMGTNSTRLLVADVEGSGAEADVKTLERLMTITRLGEGVASTRRLSSAGIERVCVVLREYRGVMESMGVERVRATATSAARDAENRDEFVKAVEDALGFAPEIITGEEEAALSFLGATAGLDAPGPFLVVDIGGGSTEFVVGTDKPEGLISIDVGCVRVTETFLHSDPPLPDELSNAVQVLRDHMADVVREVPGVRDCATLVGLAGTVSAVASIEQGLVEYDRSRIHGFRITRSAAEDVFRTLATESLEQRRFNPGLETERASVIVGGCIVLVSVLRSLGYEEVLVSESDILDGVVRMLAAT